MKRFFTPNETIAPRDVGLITIGWFAAWAICWTAFRPTVFPSLFDIVSAVPRLWLEDGLGPEIMSSLTVSIEALVLAIVVALPLAYASRTPAFVPLADGLAGMRFVSPAVFFLILLFVASSGHLVKVYMLALGEAFFLVTSVIGIVRAVPQVRLDDCRTLRMSEWQVTWYAIVRSTLDEVIDAIRDNAAMGWSMLMMVEGIVRSEGGVGVLILNSQKHFNFADVYALAAVIILVGLAQDRFITQIRQALCPWSTR